MSDVPVVLRTTPRSVAVPESRRAAAHVPVGRLRAPATGPPTLGNVTMSAETALPPLKLGALAVDPAVVLAPMAGITNPAFRTLCREFGAGLYVCEMITTRALV
ncbi:MAG: tRNA-dihydrouridine synthase, partial [Actinomycetes bacterium]